MTDIDHLMITNILGSVAADAHKGTQGHVLAIGGSYGKIGSVCLAAKASLMAGCGLVTAFIPRCGYNIVQSAIPEAMVITDKRKKFISDIEVGFTPDAVCIGPGMGQERRTKKALCRFLEHNETASVLDADALNTLSTDNGRMSLLASGSIITPHLKELQRLTGAWTSETEMFDLIQLLSDKHDIVVVAKGAPTYVCYKGHLFKNTTGNSALATAGSGDVLAGLITGLRAQGVAEGDAAKAGVYLHGLSADLALPTTGSRSFIASDIFTYISQAFIKTSGEGGAT